MKVVVPVTSLCPCSKRISDYGAHNQRSHVTITARVARARLDRGTDRHRGAGSVVRAVRHPEAPRREVRDRARLRQPEVRRGHRARRGRAAQRRAAHLRLRGRGGELRVDPQPLGVCADRARQGQACRRRDGSARRILAIAALQPRDQLAQEHLVEAQLAGRRGLLEQRRADLQDRDRAVGRITESRRGASA